MTNDSRLADFRSDTFTMPDDGMRKAIYEAEVGNAGYKEDPSVIRLERAMAEYFSCEDALFLPSATMAGQIAIRVWTRPGDVVLIEEYGHNYYFETGAMAAIAGAQAHLLRGTRGIVSPEDVAAGLRHPENACARSALVILENSSNFGGGTVYPQQTLDSIFQLATANGLPVHVDGARIWNVIAVTGWRPGSLVQAGGSMSVCFSKGLGAPMGAVLLGSTDFIREAHRIQQMLGGVMRQIGFMAAAAHYAFQHNRQRLQEDHENARFIASALAGTRGLNIDLEGVQTNMVYVDVIAGAGAAADLVSRLDAAGVRALHIGHRIRFVTSMLVTREDCEHAVNTFRRLTRD